MTDRFKNADMEIGKNLKLSQQDVNPQIITIAGY